MIYLSILFLFFLLFFYVGEAEVSLKHSVAPNTRTVKIYSWFNLTKNEVTWLP